MSRGPSTYRYRLPRGYSHLKPGIGRIIKKLRQDSAMKQESLAHDVGISRGALSRIENGAALPSPETLDRLIEAFNLDMKHFAVQGETSRRPSVINDTERGDKQATMGRALRHFRKEEKLTLAALAKLSGVPASQLSRIERGQLLTSGLIGWHPDTLHLCEDDRYMMFLNPVLRRLARGESIDDDDQPTEHEAE